MHVTICCFVHYLFPVIILFIGKVDFQGNRMPSPVIAVPLITTALVMCTTSAQSVQYYITPSPDTIPCPGVPCFTLAEYANYNSQNPSIASSVTLIFLAGVHTLVDRGVGVSNIASFSMVGDSTTLPSLKSVITCYSRAGPILGFDFTNIQCCHLFPIVHRMRP